LALLAAGGLTGLSSCCTMRPFATPLIAGDVPAVGTPLKPTVRKSNGAPRLSIDVHAHFFNGSDVPVKGYLAGPVAHDMSPPLRALVEALAPLADALAGLAPTADAEYKDLLHRFGAGGTARAAPSGSALSLDAVVDDRRTLSKKFYQLVKGTDFEKQYNAIKNAQSAESRALLRPHEQSLLNEDSLLQAVNAGSVATDRAMWLPNQHRLVDSQPYADGVLAFVGHMLSPRWHNLRDYADAYSSSPDAFGIDHAVGALVDFDGWLDYPPRSAPDDQVKLHRLLSRLSGGYMLPLVGYNPWTDVRTDGEALKRVRDAITGGDFVGVKIYPPNGYYPYGNITRPGSPSLGPSFAELDRVLGNLWDLCADLNVPVMAHTNHSSGKDTQFDQLGGPAGWRALLARFDGRRTPRVNLGHFGGDSGDNTWTQEFADLMMTPDGSEIFADAGYWSDFRCRDTTVAACTASKARVSAALQRQGVNKRLMYGSDWFMLSRERDWARYPFDVAEAIRGQPIAADDFFGLNALRCFPSAGFQVT
jgi:predicted TIM-barrel fold metal-dependent hydrolase